MRALTGVFLTGIKKPPFMNDFCLFQFM